MGKPKNLSLKNQTIQSYKKLQQFRRGLSYPGGDCTPQAKPPIPSTGLLSARWGQWVAHASSPASMSHLFPFAGTYKPLWWTEESQRACGGLLAWATCCPLLALASARRGKQGASKAWSGPQRAVGPHTPAPPPENFQLPVPVPLGCQISMYG